MINLDLNLLDDSKPLVITFVDKKYTSILTNWVAFLNEYKNYQVLIFTTDEKSSNFCKQNNFLFFENNSSSSNSSNYFSDKIKIYPNPATDIINIESNYNINSIEIVDNMGRLIMKKDSCNKLNISELESGTYSVYLYNGNQKIIKRFTKSN